MPVRIRKRVKGVLKQPLNQAPNCPESGKISFYSREGAEFFVPGRRCYQCDACGLWHHTGMTEEESKKFEDEIMTAKDDEIMTTVIFVEPFSGSRFEESKQWIKESGGKYLPTQKVWAIHSETNQDDPAYREFKLDVHEHCLIVGEGDLPDNEWKSTLKNLGTLARRVL